MTGGIYLFFSPLYEFLQVLPLLSGLGKFVIIVFAIIFSIPLTLITILSSWLAHRPKLIIVILVLVTAVVVVIFSWDPSII